MRWEIENIPSCPHCRRKKAPLLFDTHPDLFEESYNWLNCHSVPPPQPVEEVLYPEDSFEQIDFGELYAEENADFAEHQIQAQPAQKQETMVDESLQRSLRNHLLEYQIWKESIEENDKRIIWWVCSTNPCHVWRESVKSRIKSECPFCKRERKESASSSSRMIETGYGELVPVKKRQRLPHQAVTEDENTTVFYE